MNYPLSIRLLVILLLFGFSGISQASQNPYISRHGVNFATGNKYLNQNDISLSGPVSTLSFSRGYNSQSDDTSALGYGWTYSWSDKLTFDTSTNTAIYTRSDGRVSYFPYNGTDAWESELGKKDVILENTGGGYTLTRSSGTKLVFDASGNLIEKRDLNNNSITLTYTSSQLTSISDGFGRSLTLAYDTAGKLETITTPIGTYTYAYDTNDNLISVTKPDSSVRTYLYEDTADVHNLTGIIDETTTRVLTVDYDSLDRVTASSFTGGSEAITIEYKHSYQREITDSLNATTTYQLEVTNGVAKVSSFTGPGCSSCGSDSGSEYFYDDRQLLTSMIDARGYTTSYTYDSLGNKLTETKAVGTTEEYTTTYTYDASLNKVDSITVPSVSNSGQNKVTSMTFDLTGNVLTKSESGYSGTTAISRSTTYTYDTYGRVLTIDGPRTDVTDTVTLTYYANETAQGNNRGFLHTVTNAAGHTVTYSNYNGFGQAELITDANGVATSFVYNSAGRVSSRTTGGLTTSYIYDDAGTLSSVTLPGSRTISYIYNTEGQVETITDTLGNSITYSYDTEGRRTGQQIKDPSGTLKAYVDYTYDDAGRLHETINPDGGEEQLSYDEVGNLVTRINELSLSTTYSYDALNRLATITEPGSATTTFTYDTHGNQTSVTDAEGNITSFTFDDFGNRLSRTSVDTGTTTHTYDTAGNLPSKTDANSVTVSYTYDALNRLTAISYPDSTLNITYVYDQGTNGIGRLSSVTDATGSSSYTYNQFGNLTEEVRITSGESFTTTYGYNTNQELTSITYPSGRVVNYQRDGIGQISDVTSTYDSETTTISSGLSYLPFGPATSMTLGNGLAVTNTFDQQYRLASSSAGSVYNKSYSYILTGQVESITDSLDTTRSQSFTYNDLGRLISASGIYGVLDYTYDQIGNRLTETVDSSDTTQFTYQTANNRLLQTSGAETVDYTYDTAGNTLTKGTTSFTWNDDNRLENVAINATTQGTYGYDARGLRTIKTTPEGTTLSVYDLAGNLIAETDDTGTLIREYVYLGSQRLTLFDYTLTPELVVNVSTSEGSPLENVSTYAFTAADVYIGISSQTDNQGDAPFNREDFTNDSVKFRVDYLGSQFWSDTIDVRDSNGINVVVDVENTETSVVLNGVPQEGVKVYAFTESGSYLGLYGVTDSNGVVSFSLPVGENYKFRTDLYGNQYWSDATTIGEGSSATIETGGGLLSINILQDVDEPMTGLKTYLFSAANTYLGFSSTSDIAGNVSYTVPTGSYKVRVDYLGYQFWTGTFTITEDITSEFTIDHQDVAITVNAVQDQTTSSLAEVNCYLFTPSGSYQSVNIQTDANGQAFFSVPEKAYRVRADFLNQQYWSADFTWQDSEIAIEHGTATVEVTKIGAPVSNINVYAFDNEGTYLKMSGATDGLGEISFDLPAGTYRFRADYQGNQYWGDDLVLVANQNNPVLISTGGGSVVLTVQEDDDTPMEGVRTYVFNSSGSYLSTYANTDNNGQVSFDLADGTYMIRVDYLGYQYWTDVFTVPTDSEIVFPIAHRQAQINGLTEYSGETTPLSGVPVYLFSTAESYLSINATTDSNGQAFFNLPVQEYKIRLDYLSEQYMSESFTDDEFTVIVDEGIARVQLSAVGDSLADIPVYVFNDSNSYLSISGQTDEDGIVSFQLPSGFYKFRADYQSSQFWATAEVVEHSINDIALQTGGGTFSVTVRTGESTVLSGVTCYLFNSSRTYLNQNATTDENGMVSFDVADGSYQVRVDYLGAQYWSDNVGVPGTTSTTVLIEHQDVAISVFEQWSDSNVVLPGIPCYLFTEAGSYTGISSTTDENGEAHFSVPYQNYQVRADYLGVHYWSDLFIWQDATIPVPHGELALKVYGDETPSVGTTVYLFNSSGSYLGISGQTGSTGDVSFSIPEGVYQIRADIGGEQYWSDTLNVLPYEQNYYELVFGEGQVTYDPTNNPKPIRWDGEPPVYRPLLAFSGASLTGMLSQIVTQVQVTNEARAYWYISDHLSTSQLITDDSGDVVWQGDYQPFGQVDVVVDELDNHFRFPGQILDTESGLHYNWHRFYDPETGRYISADPIGLAGGMNLYAYVGGDPVTFIDPLGLAITGTWLLPERTSHIYADIYLNQFEPAFKVSSNPIGGTTFGYLPVEFYASFKLKAYCYDDCTDEKWIATFNIKEARLYINQFPIYFNPYKWGLKVLNWIRLAVTNQDKIQALAQKAIDDYEESGKNATTLCKLKKN